MSNDHLKLQNELFAMEEWKVLARIRHFDMSIRLLERSGDELLKFVKFLTEDSRSFVISDIDKRAILDLALEELIRLLHSFVAAVMSLVDHTRVFYKELYESKSLFLDYQDEVQRRFIDVPLVRFVQNLRQFAQHYRLPEVGFQIQFVQGQSITRIVYLVKSDLQSFSGWNSGAKAYLASAPEHISIEEITAGYLNSARDFYKWFKERQRQLHAEAITSVEAKQEEIRKELAKDLPNLMRAFLQIHQQGIGSLRDAFAIVLSPTEQVALAPYQQELPKWIDMAIEITEKRFGTIPPDLLAEFREKAKKDSAPGRDCEPQKGKQAQAAGNSKKGTAKSRRPKSKRKKRRR